MKIAIVAGLLAKWDMDIHAVHKHLINALPELPVAKSCPLERPFFTGIILSWDPRFFFMQGRYWLILLLIVLGFPVASKAQTDRLPVRWSANVPAERLPDSICYAQDTLALQGLVREQIRQWRALGYLEASFDGWALQDSAWLVHLHLGPRYFLTSLDVSAVPQRFLSAVGFRQKDFAGQPYSWPELLVWQDDLVAAAAERGFPFAQSELDWQVVSRAKVAGVVRWDNGASVRMDSIQVRGDVRIKPSFLQYRLNILPGQPFNQRLLDQVDDRLREIPFLQTEKEPGLLFQQDRASLVLDLQPRRSSRFDFLIGVLPNSALTDRLLITGDFEAELFNPFGAGERLYASFERLRPETQDLQLEATYPYVLGLPFGLDGAFGLYRRDTTFLNIHTEIGVPYFLGGGDQIKVFFQNQTTNLLAVDTARIRRSGTLPAQLDTRQSSFGIQATLRRLDYRLNPRRGWQVRLRGSAGMRRILRNNEIDALEGGTLYDDLTLRTAQYQLTGLVQFFQPLFQRSTLLSACQFGLVINDQGILRNEQFRLGGNRLLRGFDEEFFFATHYSILTLEYRLLIDQNAYLFAFTDGAWLENTLAEPGETVQFPYGFGTGMTLETTAGIFGLSIAVGGSAQLPVDLSAPKVHFGYVSLF